MLQVATRWYRAPELLYGSRTYDVGVDLWAIGCVFGEMLNKSPLFPGENDIDQLRLVLHTLGTPTNDTWPGMTDLPDYNKISFPPAKGTPYEDICPDAEEEAIGLLKSFLVYDSTKRISAAGALEHPYFRYLIRSSHAIRQAITFDRWTMDVDPAFQSQLMTRAVCIGQSCRFSSSPSFQGSPEILVSILTGIVGDPHVNFQ
jgi:serine/threonine protein kinase